ncbi:nuclear transport factor 2 family protein [Salinicola endophyticus]|uniref:nuclear transport factor 2 family protein n=1 Tax=Salinicola endophyticus TaxID=1949083 RepID=UPI000DA18887|nr:nuclear transport factor 2 family protein [Salinicola endophyticus]
MTQTPDAAPALISTPSSTPEAKTSVAQCEAGATRTLQRWAEAISRADAPALLALYADDAILVPTVSNAIRGTQAAREDYFRDFLSREGLDCELGEYARRVSHKLGTVVVGGHYFFRYRDGGERITIPARFLFTFEEIEGEWKITSHHSSQLA